MVGSATLTAVPSIEAMPEPRMVATRTQVGARGVTGAPRWAVRITQVSHALGITAAAPVTLDSFASSMARIRERARDAHRRRMVGPVDAEGYYVVLTMPPSIRYSVP